MQNNNKNEIVINSLIHNPEVTTTLSRLNLRMFYSSELYVAEGTKRYNEIEDSYVKCEIQSPRPGKIEYISANSDTFNLLLNVKKEKGNYTYSKITYYNKVNKKGCELKNSNENTAPAFGASIKRLIFKQK